MFSSEKKEQVEEYLEFMGLVLVRGDQIGPTFNLRRNSSVSSALDRVRKKLDADRKFRKRVAVIKEKIHKGQTEI